MFDSALTSKTVIPTDLDDGVGKADDSSLLTGTKAKSSQSLAQSKTKTAADVAAATGIDESLI